MPLFTLQKRHSSENQASIQIQCRSKVYLGPIYQPIIKIVKRIGQVQIFLGVDTMNKIIGKQAG